MSKSIENIAVLGSGIMGSQIAAHLTNAGYHVYLYDMNQDLCLKGIQFCEKLKPDFEYILIDSPAGIEQGFYTALAPADRAVVVATPEVSSIRDADRVIGLVEAATLPTPDLILNRVRPGLIKHGDMMSTEDILSLLSVNLLGLVPEDENIVISTNRGVPVVHEARSGSGTAFRRIAAILDGEDLPFLDLENNSGIFKRLRNFVGLGKGSKNDA